MYGISKALKAIVIFLCILIGAGGYSVSAVKKRTEMKSGREKNINIEEKEQISIHLSHDYIYPGGKTHLAVTRKTGDGRVSVVNPRWEFPNPVKGIGIEREGVLIIRDPLRVPYGKTVRLKAVYNDLEDVREIRILKKDPLQARYRVHYFRFDGNYKGWNVWEWQNGNAHQADFTEKTDFGMVAGLNRPNFLIRRSSSENSWEAKDTGDIHISRVMEVFIVQGDGRVFTDFGKAVEARQPRILHALMDSADEVRAYLPMAPPASLDFTLSMNGRPLSVAKAQGNTVKFLIDRKYDFDPSALFEISAGGRFTPARVTLRRVLDPFYYNGSDMGVTFSEEMINFRLWAPTAGKVSLLVYDRHDQDEKTGREIPLEKDRDGKGHWNGTWIGSVLRKENYGRFYLYKLDFYAETPYRWTSLAVDPYATAVTVNGIKGALIDVMKDPATFPEKWQPDRKPPMSSFQSAIIYELHVRDFSTDENSGIKPEYRGRFMAFTQLGTIHPRAGHVKTGLDHLQELGITHLHLMPVYDFASVDENRDNQYNWGYDPANYNVPEGSYSTDPVAPEVRIREFRSLVQSVHDSGIRVIPDVVYNHTFNTSTFDRIVPGYYYRSDCWGRYTNGSGCGNEIATERPMVRKFIVDSIRHWMRAYNVDGFRFDLMGLIDFETMRAVMTESRRIDPMALIYGEPWTGGDTSLSGELQTTKMNLRNIFAQGYEFGVFNDDFRNAIRGDNNVPRPWRAYVTDYTDMKEKILKGAMGSIYPLYDDSSQAIVTANPSQTINYTASHDNYIIWDQVVASMGHPFYGDPHSPRREDDIPRGEEMSDFLVRRAVLADAVVLTSQGIPFFPAGQELLRTKFGDHNSYKSGDLINRIRWDWKKDYPHVFNYYRGLIEIRKQHPAFRMGSRDQVFNHAERMNAPGNVVAFRLTNHANGDRWKNIIVIYNPYTDRVEMDLPQGEWSVVANEKRAGVDVLYRIAGRIAVQPVSIMILHD